MLFWTTLKIWIFSIFFSLEGRKNESGRSADKLLAVHNNILENSKTAQFSPRFREFSKFWVHRSDCVTAGSPRKPGLSSFNTDPEPKLRWEPGAAGPRAGDSHPSDTRNLSVRCGSDMSDLVPRTTVPKSLLPQLQKSHYKEFLWVFHSSHYCDHDSNRLQFWISSEGISSPPVSWYFVVGQNPILMLRLLYLSVVYRPAIQLSPFLILCAYLVQVDIVGSLIKIWTKTHHPGYWYQVRRQNMLKK